MFKKRYELKEKDGYVSIVDNRVRVARILLLGLWIVGYIIFLFTARSLGDFAMISLIFVAIVAGTELLLWMLECKYIITDEYIKMQYGFIGPKIWYRDIDRCFHNELFNITLIGNNGKETNIDLLHLDGDVDEYFLEPIRRNGIAVRKIGVFEKSSENGGYKYKFKMQMKGKVGVIIMLAFFMLFLDVIFFMLIFDSANDSGMVLLALALFIGNTILWGFLMYNYTAVFEIDNGKIAFHKCFGKAKELDVKQISWVNSEIVHQSNNGVNQDVETLNIYVNGKELGWKNKPSRNYTNYDMLVAFLQDSNVPFSLEKEEKSKKEALKLVGFIVGLVAIVALGLFAQLVFLRSESTVTEVLSENESDKIDSSSEDETSEIVPNEGYEFMLVNYDDNGTFFDGEDLDEDSSIYKWGADLSSYYAYAEYGEPEALAGHDIEFVEPDEALNFLSKAWGIYDRNSAEEVIDRVLTYGHESKYRVALDDENVVKAIEAIQNEYGNDFSYRNAKNIDEDFFKENGISKKEFYKVKGAACAYVRFGENAMLAYDYLRLVRVVTLSYRSAYITEEEAMQLIYNMETKLQSEFTSFSDIHECYYYGEMFRLAKKDTDNNYIIEDVIDTLDEMISDRFYNKIDRRFNNEITIDINSI